MDSDEHNTFLERHEFDTIDVSGHWWTVCPQFRKTAELTMGAPVMPAIIFACMLVAIHQRTGIACAIQQFRLTITTRHLLGGRSRIVHDEYYEHYKPTSLQEAAAFLPPQDQQDQWEQRGFSRRKIAVPTTTELPWQATMALQVLNSEELLDALKQPTFKLLPRMMLVPVSPCRACADGALRTAGTIRTNIGQLLVRACDTCGLVDLDPRRITSH